jgi:hypothetical protein
MDDAIVAVRLRVERASEAGRLEFSLWAKAYEHIWPWSCPRIRHTERRKQSRVWAFAAHRQQAVGG